tara:strand:- start:11062 stop:11610 length:549 start_codon:yes stop_codon:yes gene_type:complete
MSVLNPSVSVNVSNTNPTSGLNNINFLQPTSFKLTVDRKHFANLEFFCQTVLHPNLGLNAIEVPFKRVSSIPFAGDKLTFSELTAIIIVDENLNSYTEMFNWMSRLVEQKDRLPTERSSELAPTYSDITLSILSSHNNTVRTIKYLDCIPTALGDMTLESTLSDNTFITFPASFRFSSFDLK